MANYKRKKSRSRFSRGGWSTNSWRVRNGLPILVKPRKSWVAGLYTDRLAPLANEWHPYKNMMHSHPAWWDLIFHTRRRRAEQRRLEHRIMKGLDSEGMVWPAWKKPHIYYW